MRIGKWRRSQTSNGYYMKLSSKVPIFIRYELNEFENQRVYDVLRKDGLDGNLYLLKRLYTINEAEQYMIQYMKNHPYGW